MRKRTGLAHLQDDFLDEIEKHMEAKEKRTYFFKVLAALTALFLGSVSSKAEAVFGLVTKLDIVEKFKNIS